jgi:hypothetical protein
MEENSIFLMLVEYNIFSPGLELIIIAWAFRYHQTAHERNKLSWPPREAVCSARFSRVRQA